jgi:GT2 family glycosyltransferase
LFFSILIPTCNRNNFLKVCLDALLVSVNQIDDISYEVIVSDDGVANEAKKLIQDNYAWVKWIEGPQKGPAANRNNAANIAEGEWLVFLDDDCIPDSNLVISYHNSIKCNPSVKIFEGAILPEGPSTTPLDYAPINTTGGHLWSCNFCIQKKLYSEIGGFDQVFVFPHMDDIDLKTRLLSLRESILFAPKAAVIHPWRKITSGIKLGKYQEMYVLYHEKHNKPYSILKLIKAIILFHFSMLRKSSLISDIVIVLRSTVEHLIIVIFSWRKWTKKYSYER